MNKLGPAFLETEPKPVIWSRDIFGEIAKVLHFDIRDFDADAKGNNGIICPDGQGGQYLFGCRTRLNKDTPFPTAHFRIIHQDTKGIHQKTSSFSVDFDFQGLRNPAGEDKKWKITIIDDQNPIQAQDVMTGWIATDYQLNRGFVDFMKRNAPLPLLHKFNTSIKRIRDTAARKSAQRAAQNFKRNMLRA